MASLAVAGFEFTSASSLFGELLDLFDKLGAVHAGRDRTLMCD